MPKHPIWFSAVTKAHVHFHGLIITQPLPLGVRFRQLCVH
jgi:hypothetical protein